ncbi:MAG: hypothetical protein AAGC44_14845 [Planctomycetota bacterium]
MIGDTRRLDLYKLRWASVHPDAERTHLVVIAEDDKASKQRIYWIRDDLIQVLRAIKPADS